MVRFMILAALGAMLGAAAQAMPVTYAWTGTVQQVDNYGAAIGDTIAISLTLDTAVADQDSAPNRGFYATDPGSPSPLVLSVDIGGITEAGSFQTVEVLDNLSGMDTIRIDTSSQMTGAGFHLLFQSAQLGAVTGDGIPLAIDPAAFDTATFLVQPFPALSMFLPTLGGTIDAVIAEPEGLAILATGLIGLAMLRRRVS